MASFSRPQTVRFHPSLVEITAAARMFVAPISRMRDRTFVQSPYGVLSQEGWALTPTACRNAGAVVVLDSVQLVLAVAVSVIATLAVRATRMARRPRTTVVGAFEST
jgi:hypothetical protein